MFGDNQSAIASYMEEPSPEKAAELVEEHDMGPEELHELRNAYIAARELQNVEQEFDQVQSMRKWNHRKNVMGELTNSAGRGAENGLRAAGNLAGDGARYSGRMLGDSVIGGLEYTGEAGETAAEETGDVGEELVRSAGRILGETGRSAGEAGKGFVEGAQEVKRALEDDGKKKQTAS